jgi:hypothetical protein
MRLSVQVAPECGGEDDRRTIEDAIRVRLPEVSFVPPADAGDVAVRWARHSAGCTVLVESSDGVAAVPLRADASLKARSEAAARVASLAAIGMGIDPFDRSSSPPGAARWG